MRKVGKIEKKLEKMLFFGKYGILIYSIGHFQFNWLFLIFTQTLAKNFAFQIIYTTFHVNKAFIIKDFHYFIINN